MIDKLKGVLACEAAFVLLWLFINTVLGVEKILSVISAAACLGLLIGGACVLLSRVNSIIVGAVVPFAFNLIIVLGLSLFELERDLANYLGLVIVAVLMSGVGATSGYFYKLASSS